MIEEAGHFGSATCVRRIWRGSYGSMRSNPARSSRSTGGTSVRRNAAPVLAFFRANGFVGGRFVQLEQDLEDGS